MPTQAEMMAEMMAKMQAKKQSMKKTDKTAKLEPGENRVVILPGWREGDLTWYHDFGQHFIKDETDTVKAVYMCTNATFEQDCKVCSALAAAVRSAGDDAITEVLGKAKASKTVLVNALLLDSKEPTVPQILELKRGLFEQVLDIVMEYELKPLDPTGAIVLKMNRDGKGLNTKYTAMPTLKTVKISDAILAKRHNLDEYVKQQSDEQERRAIGAINSVAGVLPAPGSHGTGRDKPAALSGPKDGLEFDDIPDFDATPVSTPDAPAAAADLGDLDALLSELPD